MTLLNRWPKTGLLSVSCQKFGIKLKAIRGPQLGSYPVLGCQVPYTGFYEWFPLIHLLFDSIKPVGGMGRGSLVSDCVANSQEAPIFLRKPHWSGKPDGELFLASLEPVTTSPPVKHAWIVFKKSRASVKLFKHVQNLSKLNAVDFFAESFATTYKKHKKKTKSQTICKHISNFYKIYFTHKKFSFLLNPAKKNTKKHTQFVETSAQNCIPTPFK